MTRLLGRSLSRKSAAEHTADEEDKKKNESKAAAPEAPAPRKPPPRRRSSSTAAAQPVEAPPAQSEAGGDAERRSRRRASPAAAKNGSANGSAALEPKPPPRRRSARRESAEGAAEDPMLTALQRQTALLERQAALLEAQQQALTRLTEAMLGARRGGVAPHGAQVEVQPRLAVFVDVPNILYAAEATDVELNWGKVAAFLSEGRTLVRAIAYAPISDDPNARTENERFVVPFLEHGYRIATKPLKRFSGGSVKANFDVELAIDVLTMADRVDVIVLVSGDGDFRRLVEIVGSRGVRVEVMAFGQSTAQDLRVVADRYIDIAGYIPELTGG